ncbi:MAG: GIY-YIG nuclease family protein [Verrucomicrobiota bacterium]
MAGYLYILQSEKSGRYYIGSTNNPARRLSQHENGFVTATRSKGPWKRVALVEFSSPSIARKAEYHLKRQKNKRATEQAIAGTYPWPVFDG